MNIAEILKKCSEGAKLYSSIFGELELVDIKDGDAYPISCREIQQDGTVVICKFTKDGKIYSTDAEHTLFPSKDQRDWSKFVVPATKPKHWFKPFDKVLVRDAANCTWKCDFFSHIDNGGYTCVSTWWKYCIPYEGNEHLLGTTNNPKNEKEKEDVQND